MRVAPCAGIFGLIIAVIIATNITTPKDGKSTYSLFSGYAHLGSGLTVGLSNLATGLAMGMAGEIGVQDSARQPKLYIGMVLIWSFGSALGAPPAPLGLYQIFVYFKALCTFESSLSCPSPSALPTVMQYYCTTIAQYMIPPQPPLCMPYTIHNWYWQYPAKAPLFPLLPRRTVSVSPPPGIICPSEPRRWPYLASLCAARSVRSDRGAYHRGQGRQRTVRLPGARGRQHPLHRPVNHNRRE